MDELMEIARNVDVEQTEGYVEHSQFRNPYDILNVGQGKIGRKPVIPSDRLDITGFLFFLIFCLSAQ